MSPRRRFPACPALLHTDMVFLMEAHVATEEADGCLAS